MNTVRHRLRLRHTPERTAGLLFVVALHVALLYGLFKFQIIPMPDTTVMVSFIDPAPQEASRRAEPPKHIEPPRPQEIAAASPTVKPAEPVAPLPPATVAPPVPSLPVVLASELAVSCPERAPPQYPLISRRLNEQGRVVLRVELGEDGRIANISVKSGSGAERLDAAALSAVKNWRCNPVMRNGVAVRAVALQPFNFTLLEN